MNDITMMMIEYDVIGINQCMCLPKAELNTKNSTRWQLCCHLVKFLDFNSIVDVEKKVTRVTREMNTKDFFVH